MEISDINGNSFKLLILGYQFPELEAQDYDSNWLNIEIAVKNHQGSWVSHDPCLLTYEIARLADWFESIAKSTNTKSTQKFIEPHIKFHLIDCSSKQYLKIFFELTLKPEWVMQNYKITKDTWVDFPVTELDLNQIVFSLRSQLSKYPQRTAK